MEQRPHYPGQGSSRRVLFAFVAPALGCALILGALFPSPWFANKNLNITFAGTGTGSVVIDDTTNNTFDGTCTDPRPGTTVCVCAVGSYDVGT